MEEKHIETPADAVMAVAVLAVQSDGQIQEAELDRLAALANINPLFEAVADKRAYVQGIVALVGGQPPETVLSKAYRMLPSHLRESAYAWAAELVETDDKVTDAERAFMEKLRRALDISEPFKKQVSSMMAILKRR
ncbi:MAG: hypothetical protein A2X36_09585 [Elusimicrobia bacterium GWA2_69_24]|nr:MAG: hypothetical protein A2X36_09585 [Elusimicrobia bacterium GWA2_69_24]HBL17992.1 hypothetical protein [Elusimicrobiota bacterium]